MPQPPLNDRPRIRPRQIAVRTGILLGSLFLVGTLGLLIAQGQVQIFGRPRVNDKELTTGVYLPTDRSLSRAMTRARERLAEHEYHQALTFLQEVLAKDEDTFLERSPDATEQQGLKTTARKMIGDLPPEGRKAYELLNAATARRRLEAALATGDQDGIALVVRQFFHTPAGYEATLVLAQMEADHGHHLAAAELYRELIETPQAAAQFEPQLSVLAATNHLAAGQPELATSVLRSLFERNPAARVELSGRTDSVPGGQADPVAWLSDLIGKPVRTVRDEPNWLTLRGDPTRNARPSGGAPHLRTRWQARVVNNPTVESYLVNRSDQFAQRGSVAIPGARPIAVGDVVLMRTPYNIVAVDWHTGKRIWETREEDELDGDGLSTDLAEGSEVEGLTSTGNSLEQRVWDDALVTSLGSDGDRAFVIRCPLAAAQDDAFAMAWQAAPGFGGPIEVGTGTANQLVAYDLATQGKLLWELDGNRATGPLAGAFFFGAPLAIDNTLYVMAEIRGAVYLVALEPRTGEVKWQQQLVGLEQGIGLDPARRMVGAVPSYAGGILVCPTSAGAAVAIDVVKREFAWVYRYPRDVSSSNDMRLIWQQQQNSALRTANRWRDNLAIIDDGRVFLTPPESGELYCLELQTGKFLWKHPKRDALFLACVDQGRALLVAKDSVRALRVEDGTPMWTDPLPLPEGALPSGQGYLSDGRYFLPVTTGGIVAVDLARGKTLAETSAQQSPALGNLICYRGSVMSQSPLVLDKFEQSEVLRKRAESALARNPDDATALRELSEMRRAEGKTSEAVDLLKRAVALAPDDPLAREMLAEVLLVSLASDFARYRSDIPLVNRLIRGREQEVEMLRIEAQGLDALGERLPALKAYLRLVDFSAEAPVELRIDPAYMVRSDRWVCGRLGKLWAAATPDEQATFAEMVGARRPSTDGQRTAAEMRHYLSHFGELPGAEAVRLQLALWLMERRHTREAEIELLALVASPEAETKAAAVAILAELLAKTASPVETTPWPRGAVDAQVRMLTESNEDRTNQPSRQERQPGLRRLNIEQDAWPGFGTTQWFVSTDGTELVARNGAGNDIFRLPVENNNWAQQNRNNSFVHAARLGHLVIVSLGGQIVAVDSSQAEHGASGEVLWQAYPLGRFPIVAPRALAVRGGRRAVVFDTWSGRNRNSSAAAPVAGSLGPATPGGIVFQEQNELKCVDPLSGETLWMRTDVPAGCELFGDRELVFAADVGAGTAHVFRMIDGVRLDDRSLPKFPWMLTAGRNVAQREILG
ncbi:MAG: PQQ-binding-like beta-propeller repeat protein, partial [Pirellulales bacterium]